ncbi:MAG: formylglycine-generating enzyme family protein [Hyphomicrobiales bacterium]
MASLVLGGLEVEIPQPIAIPGGSFVMGRADSRPDEAPPHRVTVRPFRAAVAPVSNAEYAGYVRAAGTQPAPFLGEERFAAPDLPVVGINWFEAVAYCEWLRETTGIPFRLPTEAEREWAALGGRPGGDWPWPGEEHPAAALITGIDGPHVPTAACANGYGLRCMAENVHEWCSDWYSRDYYADSPEEDPRGPAEGRRRASRGGAWRHRIVVTRINARSSLDPSFHYSDYGFRVYADAE